MGKFKYAIGGNFSFPPVIWSHLRGYQVTDPGRVSGIDRLRNRTRAGNEQCSSAVSEVEILSLRTITLL